MLSVCEGGSVITLDQVESREDLRIVSDIGSRLPVFCTSQGKVFLAHMSRAGAENLLRGQSLTQFTPHTITDIPSLLQREHVTHVLLITDAPLHTLGLTQSLEKLSLLKLVSSETGIRPSNFEDHFSIIYANKEFSDLLKCSLRTPLLEVTQRVLTFDNKTIYVNKQYILTSKYIYAVRSSK